MRHLRPCEIADSILDVDYERLHSSGIRTLLFDLDRTLGPAHMKRLPRSSADLLLELRERGFGVGVLTNRRWAGDNQVICQLGESYPTIHHARKPSRRGYLALLEQLHSTPNHAAMIGDRRWTDVYGANRIGIYSILVRRACCADR